MEIDITKQDNPVVQIILAIVVVGEQLSNWEETMQLPHFVPLFPIIPLGAMPKKWNFSLKISLVNVTKSAVSCGFGQIYWRYP